MNIIDILDFSKVEMRVGTIIEASLNKGARKKAYKLKIYFGDDIGIKMSSAQITDLYKPEDLINKQIIAVINLKPIKVSEVKSEVLVLGVDTKDGVCLLRPDSLVSNGSKIY